MRHYADLILIVAEADSWDSQKAAESESMAQTGGL